MNQIITSSLVLSLGASVLLAADDSSSTAPSKKEDRRIEKVVGEEVGRSAREGITVSGDQAFVTRNGKTEELMEPLLLDDGTRVLPDGTITTAAGKKVTLKQEQVLRFNGKILEVPVAEPAPPVVVPELSAATPGTVETTTGAASSSAVIVSDAPVATTTVDSAGSDFIEVPFVVAPESSAQSSTLIASEVTKDPRTGEIVYSAVNPATGQLVRTTKDPRTNQSVSTTTLNGREIRTTTNPRTGLPVTITTDSRGRSTAMSIDPTTGKSVPVQFNATTGEITNIPVTNAPAPGSAKDPDTRR